MNRVAERWDEVALLNTAMNFRINQKMYSLGTTILLQNYTSFIFVMDYVFRSLWTILKSC